MPWLTGKPKLFISTARQSSRASFGAHEFSVDGDGAWSGWIYAVYAPRITDSIHCSYRPPPHLPCGACDLGLSNQSALPGLFYRWYWGKGSATLFLPLEAACKQTLRERKSEPEVNDSEQLDTRLPHEDGPPGIRKRFCWGHRILPHNMETRPWEKM